MGQTVKVTRVVVDYAFEGKTFTVEFPDPSKIAAIVFSKTDLDRLQLQQSQDNKEAVVTRRLSASRSWPAEIDGVNIQARNTLTGTNTAAASTVDRSLWWHSTSCSWFHPEDE